MWEWLNQLFSCWSKIRLNK